MGEHLSEQKEKQRVAAKSHDNDSLSKIRHENGFPHGLVFLLAKKINKFVFYLGILFLHVALADMLK